MAQLKDHKVLCSNAAIIQLNFYADVPLVNPLVHAKIYCGSIRKTYEIYCSTSLSLGLFGFFHNVF